MRALWRLALGPVLLWQGARVRRTIMRMPEPEGARTGGSGPVRLLILGDSSAAGVGVELQDDALSGRLAEAFGPGLRWTVLAQTGWTTADALSALGDTGVEADAAVICLGVNDVTTETGIRRWLATYGSILERLSQRGVRHFYLCGLPPMGRFPALPQPLRWYMGLQADAHDQALKDFAAERGARHVPVESDLPASAAAEDGFHPGPMVYAELGSRFAKLLRADFAKGASADAPQGSL